MAGAVWIGRLSGQHQGRGHGTRGLVFWPGLFAGATQPVQLDAAGPNTLPACSTEPPANPNAIGPNLVSRQQFENLGFHPVSRQGAEI